MIDSIYYLVAYFFAGILQEFLFTLGIRYTSKDKAALASLFAFLDNVVSIGVLYNIFRQLDEDRTIGAVLIYSLGVAAGTYIAMKFKHGMKMED